MAVTYLSGTCRYVGTEAAIVYATNGTYYFFAPDTTEYGLTVRREPDPFDDRIAQRNAANAEAYAELLNAVRAPVERRRMFRSTAMPCTRSPRFRRPQKRSRGPVGVY